MGAWGATCPTFRRPGILGSEIKQETSLALNFILFWIFTSNTVFSTFEESNSLKLRLSIYPKLPHLKMRKQRCKEVPQLPEAYASWILVKCFEWIQLSRTLTLGVLNVTQKVDKKLSLKINSILLKSRIGHSHRSIINKTP